MSRINNQHKMNARYHQMNKIPSSFIPKIIGIGELSNGNKDSGKLNIIGYGHLKGLNRE